jgi:outer membrane immunogenic protein
MKNILAAVLMASVATTAMAADLPRRSAAPAPAPVYVPPPFTWTGFYVGANAAYGWSDYRGSGGNVFGKPAGGLLGGTVGYNYQIGQIVIGVEDNLDWADMTKGRSFANGISTKSRVDAFNTLFLRGGYAIDRTLLFVEGGWSAGDLHNKLYDSRNNIGVSESGWRNGWGLGGGIEYAFTNNITARADYVYSQLQSKTDFGGTPYAVKSGLNVSQIRVGVNYKF